MKQTQNERIIQYFIAHGSITQVDAMNELGIMRLAPRINELRKRGYKIISKFETCPNRYGESVTYARYEAADIEQFQNQVVAEDSQIRE